MSSGSSLLYLCGVGVLSVFSGISLAWVGLDGDARMDGAFSMMFLKILS